MKAGIKALSVSKSLFYLYSPDPDSTTKEANSKIMTKSM